MSRSRAKQATDYAADLATSLETARAAHLAARAKVVVTTFEKRPRSICNLDARASLVMVWGVAEGP